MPPKRSANAQNDEPEPKRHQGTTGYLNGLVLGAASILDVWGQGIEGLKRRHDAARQENEKLKLELEKANKARVRAEEEATAFEKRYYTMLARRDEIEEPLLSAPGEYLSPVVKSEDDDYKDREASNDEITRRWFDLVNKISQLATDVLSCDPKHQFSVIQGLLSPATTGLYEAIKARTKLRVYILQQHIWSRIYEQVFLGGGRFWCGEPGTKLMEFFQSLADAGSDSMEELSALKGRAGEHLNGILGSEKRYDVGTLAMKLGSELALFWDASSAANLVLELESILSGALELQIIFNTSRAFFVPRRVDDFGIVDEDRMDVQFYLGDPTEMACLDLAISPMIIKIGGADGRNFDSSCVICKALITVAEKHIGERSPGESEVSTEPFPEYDEREMDFPPGLEENGGTLSKEEAEEAVQGLDDISAEGMSLADRVLPVRLRNPDSAV